jgi:hypothetical protein
VAVAAASLVAAASASAASLDFSEQRFDPGIVDFGGFRAVDTDTDGDPDLVVTQRRPITGFNALIYLNDGAGHFKGTASNPIRFPRFTFTGDLAIADLDGDADQDLAITNEGSRWGVFLLKNNGRAHFHEPNWSPVPTDANPHGIAPADYDGDSDIDLAIQRSSGGAVTLLKNHGNGNFFEASSSPEPSPEQTGGLTSSDLDGDGTRTW